MSFDYSELLSVADDLLAEFGQQIAIKMQSSASYDPATGESVVTETTQITQAVILDYGDDQIDGTLIQRGDKQVIISATGMTVFNVGDHVLDSNGNLFVINHIENIAPSGVLVLLVCTCRGIGSTYRVIW